MRRCLTAWPRRSGTRSSKFDSRSFETDDATDSDREEATDGIKGASLITGAFFAGPTLRPTDVLYCIDETLFCLIPGFGLSAGLARS
jgi:hypothetical protein